MTQMRNDHLQEPLLYGHAIADSVAVKNRRICYISVVAMCVICLTVVVIISLGLIVVIPRVITSELQKAKIRANYISISNPTENGFSIAIDASVALPESYVVYTKPATVELLYGSSVITDVVMDGMKLSSSLDISLNSTCLIQNENAFAKLTNDLVTKSTVELGFRSTLDVIPLSNLFGNLTKCSVFMDKILVLTGFNGIKPAVKTFSFIGGDGSIIQLKAIFDIDNPTVFSLDPVGVLSFDLFSDSIHLGQAVSESSWSIAPGLNKDLSIVGTITPITEEQIEKVAEIVQDLASGKNATMIAVSAPPYSSESVFAKGLANITVEFEIVGSSIG